MTGLGALGTDNTITTVAAAQAFSGVNILYGNLLIPQTTCGNLNLYNALVAAFASLVEIQGYVNVSDCYYLL